MPDADPDFSSWFLRKEGRKKIMTMIEAAVGMQRKAKMYSLSTVSSRSVKICLRLNYKLYLQLHVLTVEKEYLWVE